MCCDDITAWISKLKSGDEQAAQAIWEKYFDKLIRIARQNLRGARPREFDEEDVVLSAMNSFFRSTKEGRFPRLGDRHDLWKLLLTFTIRKVNDQRRRQFAQKRGAGNVRGDSAFAHKGSSSRNIGIEQVLAVSPTPEVATILTETLEELWERLGDDTLKKVALHKMEGYTNVEIAQKLDCSKRTVERKLERIARRWTELRSTQH